MTPVTQKISAAKKKHFKSVFTPALPIELVDDSFVSFRGPSKPMPSLFGESIADTSDDEDGDTIPQTKTLGIPGQMATTEDNPF
jgi:hypothetical protein